MSNEVRENVGDQGQIRWGLEAGKGANWCWEIHVAFDLKSSIDIWILVSSITLKKLIRKRAPPVLRLKVEFSLSWGYYNDLIIAAGG